MKNWDILSAYIFTEEPTNWFLDMIKTKIYKDLDTQLYIIFVGKNLKYFKKFLENSSYSPAGGWGTEQNEKVQLRFLILQICKRLLDKLL